MRRSYSFSQAWCPKLAGLTLERGKPTIFEEAEVAQVVEQRTENPRVSSSTLLLGTLDAEVAEW